MEDKDKRIEELEELVKIIGYKIVQQDLPLTESQILLMNQCLNRDKGGE